MASRVRVQLGDERSDRPRWLVVGATAIAGLGGGLLLAVVLGRSLNANNVEPGAAAASAAAVAQRAPSQAVATEPAVDHQPPNQGGAGQAPVPVAADVAAANARAASDVAQLPATATGVAGTAVPAAPAAAPPPTSAQHVVVHGQLAYLRCDGVPLESGPYPCPRDRRFERQVWSAIDSLQQCALPALASSDVELRVELRSRGGKHSFEVRPAIGTSEEFVRAASACVAPGLESLRTQLRPILMMVAFRFELQ